MKIYSTIHILFLFFIQRYMDTRLLNLFPFFNQLYRIRATAFNAAARITAYCKSWKDISNCRVDPLLPMIAVVRSCHKFDRSRKTISFPWIYHGVHQDDWFVNLILHVRIQNQCFVLKLSTTLLLHRFPPSLRVFLVPEAYSEVHWWMSTMIIDLLRHLYVSTIT